MFSTPIRTVGYAALMSAMIALPALAANGGGAGGGAGSAGGGAADSVNNTASPASQSGVSADQSSPGMDGNRNGASMGNSSAQVPVGNGNTVSTDTTNNGPRGSN
jgi:hypothetical protein